MKNTTESMMLYRKSIVHSFGDLSPFYVNATVLIEGNYRDANISLLETGKLCLFGNAGSGKTTLLRYLSAVSAQTSDRPLPIFIPMSNISIDISRLSVSSFVKEFVSTDMPDELLNYLIQYQGSNSMIILDGLNETLSPCREQIKNAIKRWEVEWPNAHWVLSIRSFFENLIPEGFVYAEIQPFNEQQINDYLRLRQTVESSNNIQTKIRNWPALYPLAQNPLLLGMISRLAEDIGDIPSDRTELYSSCVDIILRSWDKEKAIPTNVFLPPVKMRSFLSSLALEMCVSGKDYLDTREIDEVLNSSIKTNLGLKVATPNVNTLLDAFFSKRV